MMVLVTSSKAAAVSSNLAACSFDAVDKDSDADDNSCISEFKPSLVISNKANNSDILLPNARIPSITEPVLPLKSFVSTS